MRTHWFGGVLASLCLAGCSSAAMMADSAIMLGTLGMVSDMPLTDMVDGNECRNVVKQEVGDDMRQQEQFGPVIFTESYSCDGNRIDVAVTLQNTSRTETWYCYANTRRLADGTRVGPKASARFEYSMWINAGGAEVGCDPRS